jgi:hypothetical protein
MKACILFEGPFLFPSVAVRLTSYSSSSPPFLTLFLTPLPRLQPHLLTVVTLYATVTTSLSLPSLPIASHCR